MKVSLSVSCPKNLKINENIEIKELKNDKGTKVYFRISFPRSLVSEAVGDAPKKIIKGMKRLNDSSSSSENRSDEHRVAEQSLSNSDLTSNDGASLKNSK